MFTSCQKNHVKENVFGDNVSLNIEELAIRINENTLQEYYLLSSFKTEDGAEVIVGYNDMTHALDIIDLQNKEVSNVFFQKEGVDAIPLSVTGLHAYKKDSIWLYNYGNIYLMNNKGTLKTTIPTLTDDLVIVNTNYSMGSVKLYFNKKRRSLFYASKSFVYEHFVDSNTIVKYRIKESSFLKGKEATEYGWKQTPNISYTDNVIIYNYPIASDFYVIDLSTGDEFVFGGKSRYTNNISNQIGTIFTFDNAERHKVENIHFFEFLYSKKYNSYFRLHLGEGECIDGKDLYESYNQKKLYITVFDKDFSVIHETELIPNKYCYINSWVSVDSGLILFNKQATIYNEETEILALDLFYPI